ncbi:MAG: tetratricopeptide repeat protein [Gemmatimonadota bacterium]
MPDTASRSPYEEFASIAKDIATPAAAARRDAIKSDIIALYKSVDREITSLSELKDRIRSLVGEWKVLQSPAHEGAGPAPSELPPAPTRADHLNASTFIEKGWSLMSLGDLAAATAALERALDLAPEDPQALLLRGWTLMLQEKHDEALLDFQRVLMKEPQNSLARVNVGYICLRKRIFGEAIEHLSKAIRIDNDRKAVLYAHYYLGLLYLEREMYEDAQIFFRKSIALGPNLVEAQFEYGRALWFGGDRDGAREAWRAGAATNKFNPWSTRCAEMLSLVDSGGEPG